MLDCLCVKPHSVLSSSYINDEASDRNTVMSSHEEEIKVECFLQWLKVTGVELRGCKIKHCDSKKGFGIFLSNGVSDGVPLVVPLDLAITPRRVLQDPLIGPECRRMFEEGEVDDRFLMILFLTVERLCKNSSSKSDNKLLELKGTTLYRATELQVSDL